jgi:hypothetical protein
MDTVSRLIEGTLVTLAVVGFFAAAFQIGFIA